MKLIQVTDLQNFVFNINPNPDSADCNPCPQQQGTIQIIKPKATKNHIAFFIFTENKPSLRARLQICTIG